MLYIAVFAILKNCTNNSITNSQKPTSKSSSLLKSMLSKVSIIFSNSTTQKKINLGKGTRTAMSTKDTKFNSIYEGIFVTSHNGMILLLLSLTLIVNIKNTTQKITQKMLSNKSIIKVLKWCSRPFLLRISLIIALWKETLSDPLKVCHLTAWNTIDADRLN